MDSYPDQNPISNPMPYSNATLRVSQDIMVLSFLALVVVLQMIGSCIEAHGGSEKYVSAAGDPGMKSSGVRVSFEAWNFCNEVGAEAPTMASPRIADCADLYCPPFISDSLGNTIGKTAGECEVHQRVNESDNALKAGDEFPIAGFKSYEDPDLYAVEKERYLGSLCENNDSQDPWHFWMIMLKNGNFDKNTTLCPENGKKVSKIVTNRTFPCFGNGCMNQPLVYQNYSRLVSSGDGSVYLTGGFYGTYDLDADLSKGVGKNSYFSVSWQKSSSTGSWVFSHTLTTFLTSILGLCCTCVLMQPMDSTEAITTPVVAS